MTLKKEYDGKDWKSKTILKILFGVLIIQLIVLFFCFLAYRILGHRREISPLFLTGLFLSFFFGLKLIIFFLRSCVEVNRIIKKLRNKLKEKLSKKQKKEPEEQIEEQTEGRISKILKKIEDFFFYNVLQFGYKFYGIVYFLYPFINYTRKS